MARVKGSNIHAARRKKVLKAARGYFGSKHKLYKTAKEQVMHSLKYAYRDRRQTKRNMRKLWITRINAACRMNEISYSKFIDGLNKAGVTINRKMLSEIAINDMDSFKKLVEVAKKGLDGKETRDEKVAKNEITVGKKTTAKKTETKKVEKKEEKKETKKTTTKKVDYSAMKVDELKKIAEKKKIDVKGLKKAEIIAALEK